MSKFLLKKTAISITLGLIGFLINRYSYELAYGVSFSFGGIFSALSLLFLNPYFGSVSSLISSSCTYTLYHHPYAIIIWTFESLLTGLFQKYFKTKSLLISDSIYWLFIGIPLIFVFYYFVLANSINDTFTIGLKQAINGILNVLIAQMFYFVISQMRMFKVYFSQKKYSFNEILFNLATFLLLLPSFIFLVFLSKKEIQNAKSEVVEHMRDLFREKSQFVEEWLDNYTRAIAELSIVGTTTAQRPSLELQNRLAQIKTTFPDFYNVYLANSEAITYAFYPPINEKAQSTIGLNFAQRSYYSKMKNLEPLNISEVFMGRGGISAPIVTITKPIIVNEKFSGFALGALNLNLLSQKLSSTINEEQLFFTILDQNHKVIATNFADRLPNSEFVLANLKIKDDENNYLKIRVPPTDNKSALISDWKRSFYFHEESFKKYPWTLIIEYPIALSQKKVFENIQLVLFFTFILILVTLLISQFLSHQLTSTLRGLALISFDSKLTSHSIVWPDSQIEEVSQLSDSFKLFHEKIAENLAEINQLNKNLELNVADRTLALSKSEERYRLFFEKNLAPMMVVNPSDGKILNVNGAAEIMYGWPKEEFCSKYIYEFSNRSKEVFLADAAPIKNGELKYITAQHRMSNGEVKHVEIYPSSMSYLGLDVIFSTIHDITDRIESQKIIESQRASLVSKGRMALLGEMAGGVAHEINNPLAIIRGKMEIMKTNVLSETIDKVKAQDSMNKILLMVDRIAKIVKGLKNFSQDTDEVPFVETSVSSLIEETLNLCTESLSKRRIDIQYENLANFNIYCQPSQISQVILNLISNSSDAISQLSEKWIKIEVNTTQTDILISITDSGTGIPPKVVERMMQPFFTTKEIGKGTGLGLSLALGIISAHNGTLNYVPESPNTKFIIQLPLKRAA